MNVLEFLFFLHIFLFPVNHSLENLCVCESSQSIVLNSLSRK